MRESVERQRHAENLINEKLLREKNKQIQEQNEILNRQAQFLSEHQALLKEVLSSNYNSKLFFIIFQIVFLLVPRRSGIWK